LTDENYSNEIVLNSFQDPTSTTGMLKIAGGTAYSI